ncbi:MATE family efflux transporter [Steroidobacter sp. S1-65]|uniref:Multidrug-efflux transporter n=1 Tax=Steroidobacter gossypii TaxID=2805490 RepID=A0ABS1WU22_9GAMM|nr:MATE family efflux transporter [Steroidobacter gossypii]MBM0104476.1 MATE family efflux transporter [Steroidobacter gossypii]
MTITSRDRLVVDARAIVALGGPLLGNNLSITGMAFADTIMAGQLGAVDLAGLAVGAASFNLFMFTGFGLLMATSPSVAHAFGANDRQQVTTYARQSWWLVMALSILLFLGMRQADWFLPAVGIAEEVLPVAIGYVHAISWGMPALLAFFSLRYTSEGLGRTKPIMFTGFLGLTVNVIGNWIFMYGKFGAPALGAVGCGVATAISMWLMFFAMFLHVRTHRAYRPFNFFARVDRPNWPVLGELTRIGAPIAGSILAEGGLFVAAALMMGSMGAVTAAGHQIALNYAAFMFMVPLAISSATTIHVGHTLGRGDVLGARNAGLIGVGMCAIVMTVSAIVILLLNDQIAALYTRDVPVRELAASLLLMAALFQFSDGVQVGAAGALRGFKDTTIPMMMCVFSYWVVGFTFAYHYGVYRGEGPVLVWVGLNVGLTVSAILLVVRYLRVTRARIDSAGQRPI